MKHNSGGDGEEGNDNVKSRKVEARDVSVGADACGDIEKHVLYLREAEMVSIDLERERLKMEREWAEKDREERCKESQENAVLDLEKSKPLIEALEKSSFTPSRILIGTNFVIRENGFLDRFWSGPADKVRWKHVPGIHKICPLPSGILSFLYHLDLKTF